MYNFAVYMDSSLSSHQIRKLFIDFFASKEHKAVLSAPIVVKGDPTLMFTNAGMNQFKDYFLNNAVASDKRVVNSQKCLRVSGKHNDLEEVGHDHYHHTMFEMLGNWSFGNYFKTDAIAWAWELLTQVYKLPANRLYVTVFEGDVTENLAEDTDSKTIWKQWIAEDRILYGNKKDNFWEMGDTGPCGPCTEIHYDGRTDEERAAIDGKTLVNADHEQVIEIWNNVFMEFNRKADGSLEKLPAQHVDTGMGFERLVRIIQGKQSNYDTDIFQYLIQHLANVSGKPYGSNAKADIAMRVIADHVRAVSLCIADGQLPASNGAGYVVRRILRRAVRYGYSYLGFTSPFIHTLVPKLLAYFENAFPGLEAQSSFVAKAIEQEELSFFRTLSKGIHLLNVEFAANTSPIFDGALAFELYDTFGFPVDLTDLICRENGKSLNMDAFNTAMEMQKNRSKKDAEKETGDWIEVKAGDEVFTGYDSLINQTYITRYRTIKTKGKEEHHVLLNENPFYAESGGQIGDTGELIIENITFEVLNCTKENKLHVLVLNTLPSNLNGIVTAKVNKKRRFNISCNHSATHLMQSALKQVLGSHVAQKGSLVSDTVLRFDFNHFEKVNETELQQIEDLVNAKIQESIALEELRDLPINEAKEMGATALFGEKYGDTVRVIIFDKAYSMELCGGTHVANTKDIKLFKFVTESSVAAGVRRVEAITNETAIQTLYNAEKLNNAISETLNNPKDILQGVIKLKADNAALVEKIAKLEKLQIAQCKAQLIQKDIRTPFGNAIIENVELQSAEAVKDLCFQLNNKLPNLFCCLTYVIDDKPGFAVIINEELQKNNNWNASNMVRDWGKYINGGGGGQAFFATAGGKNIEGLSQVLKAAKEYIHS